MVATHTAVLAPVFICSQSEGWTSEIKVPGAALLPGAPVRGPSCLFQHLACFGVLGVRLHVAVFPVRVHVCVRRRGCACLCVFMGPFLRLPVTGLALPNPA